MGVNFARRNTVIQALEAWEGWESSNIVAAKAYAAWQMRNALSIDLPDPSYAQMHIDFQRLNFTDYERTVWCARDREAGKHYIGPPADLSTLTARAFPGKTQA